MKLDKIAFKNSFIKLYFKLFRLDIEMSSHDILRDLALSSTSKYEAINSNQKLLNYATYQNNETETRKILADV